jgi:uncharacterized protein
MVVDNARVLAPDAVARINRLIFDLKSKYGGEIVVVTLPDIEGREAADIALRIGREWKVGDAAEIGARTRNAGVVVLVVPKETASDGRGQIAIQTGRGAEGFITDGMAGDIRRAAIPYFQRQDYSGALEVVTTRLVERFEFEFGPDSARRELGRRGPGEVSPQAMLALFIFLLILFSVMGGASRGGGMRGCLYALAANAVSGGRRHRGGGHWGGGFGGGGWGGGGGGGFGGFGGGGGFSGGGSSGSW